MKSIEVPISSSVVFTPVRLIVSARVHYWEDAKVNGVPDEDGSRIPLREGDLWKPTINLDEGRVENWPVGTTAKVHYKVCDEGEYWLEDANGARVKRRSCYVPDALLCHGDRGYGDYIILAIKEDGRIEGWTPPIIDGDDWEMEPAVA